MYLLKMLSVFPDRYNQGFKARLNRLLLGKCATSSLNIRRDSAQTQTN